MVDFSLSGKVALVTGGSKGIGYAIAKGLAESGAKVALCSRNLAEAEKAAKSLSNYMVESAGFCADISKIPQTIKLVEETVKRFGKIDILVNNAGIQIWKPSLEVTEEIWDTVLNTNLKGLFFCAQAVAKEMVKKNIRGRL